MAQSTASGTSSRRYPRERNVSVSSSSRYMENEWEAKEALPERELEEARARAAQMEKTMKWWSDCTANWREKWSKVRNERNLAREEAKVLREKLEIAVKDANTFKHESLELEIQNEQLKREMEKIHMILLKHAGQFDQQIFTVLESDPQLRNTLGIDELLKFYNNVERSEAINSQKSLLTCKSFEESNEGLGGHSVLPNRDIEEYVLQGAVPKHAVELYKESPNNSLDRDVGRLLVTESNPDDKVDKHQSSIEICNDDGLKQKMTMLQLKSEETAKTISEREEKSSLHLGIEKLRVEVVQLRKQCDELREGKTEAIRELLELKERFQVELSDAQAVLLDEASSREEMNERLSELRSELERLQGENAAEWGKRERLETEKISLERENKQLRNELRDVQDQIESRKSRPVSTTDSDAKLMQQDLLVRNMALLKKSLKEKTTELSHAVRRSEQYEAEVKRVRARVDVLKKELAAAQDEVDAATNTIRKLQRQNEDLMEQLESINVQLEHFRNSTSSAMTCDGSVKNDDKLDDHNDDEETYDFESEQP